MLFEKRNSYGRDHEVLVPFVPCSLNQSPVDDFQESPNVRTCYIHFLLSFLVESNPGVIKEYFDRKTRLGRLKIPEDIE
jgi:hypothetical protein